MHYVVVDTGCIECGESTSVLGIFTNKSKAEEVLEDHRKRQKENWHGQHCFEIFEVENIDQEIRIEY